MSNKDEQLELLSAYLDGEVTDVQRAEVEAWLAANGELRRAYDELLGIRQSLQAGPSLQVGQDFLHNILDQITREDARPWAASTVKCEPKPTRTTAPGHMWAGSWPWIASVATVAAALLVALAYYEDQQPEPSGPPVAVDSHVPSGEANHTAEVDPALLPRVPGTSEELTLPDTLRVDAPTSDAPFITGELPEGMQFMSMFDVLITESAYRDGVFQKVLGEADIKLDEGIKVDETLEQALFGTRLLGRLEDPDAPQQSESSVEVEKRAATLNKVDLIYVVATGPQIDRVYRRLTELAPNSIRGLRMDLALTQADSRLFQELHRAAGLLLAGETTKAQVFGVARRVVMSLAAETRLLRQLRALALPSLGFVDGSSPQGLLPGAADVETVPKPDPSLEVSQESCSAMFVLRVVPN